MSFSQHQLPTPSDTPKNMDMNDDSESSPLSYSYAHHSTTWTPIDGITPISTNPSRKRSRDESAFETADADGSYFPSLVQQVSTPAPIPEEEPIYGEGMVLLNPRTGLAISAESQTGTWYEEKVEKETLVKEVEAIDTANQFRPKIPASRKSMRLSQSSIKLDLANIIALQGAPTSPPKTACTSTRPEVDEATMALGIGWTRMSNEDENIQAAARGWARYLENHYARRIHGAEILLRSSGLNAFLVGCHEGFYLFSEDLLEGKLVARTWESCLANLQAQPMTFESDEVLGAERTPGPESKCFEQGQQLVSERIENWADYNRLNNVNGEPGPALEHGGMEID